MNDDALKDRRVLQAALNDIMEKYQGKKLEMDKLSTATPQHKAELKNMALNKAKELVSQSDDLNKLNQGQSIKIAGASPAPLNANEVITNIPSGPENKINTKQMMKEVSGPEFANKISALKGLGKKVAGVIPMAGTAYALASGDPAMAADQMAGDIPVLGQAYEAIKPESAGNVEEEDMMIAEDKARKAYANSPAAQARRLALENLKK